MTYVVTEPCFGCKYTDCVVVCPTECFREGENMLYIDPECCVDCDACKSECPVDAIFYEDDVPEAWKAYILLNAEMAPLCPSILERKTPLAKQPDQRE
jgi:ferredoxin